MNDAISKTTLYDMLTMVIPGFLLLMLFPLCCPCWLTNFQNGTSIFMLFIACYIVGLIYHKAIESLFNKLNFRNNTKQIEKMYNKFCCDFKKDGEIIPKEKEKIQNKHQYYKAYYRLMNNNMLNNIPTLEAHVAFIRNLMPVLLLYIVALCCCRCCIFCINSCGLAIALLVVFVILMVLFFEIQDKIYYLVWEGEAYLEEIEQDKLKNSKEKKSIH